MGKDFLYFTYEEYDKLMDMMLYNIWKNTYISKEDLKQNLFIFIFNLENRIKNRNDILNIKGYIVHCLKQKTRNVAKEYFKKITERVTIDVSDLEDILISDSNVENYIVNKVYVENLFDYYDISEDEKKLLLYERDNHYRNERFILSRRLKNKMLRVGDRKMWRV